MSSRAATDGGVENNHLHERIASLEQMVEELSATLIHLRQKCEALECQATQLSLFSALAENSPDAIALVNLEGTIIYANPTSRTMTSFGDASIGMTIFEIFADDATTLADHFHSVLTHGSWSGVLTTNRSDGTTFQAQVSATLICDTSGQHQVVAGTVRDITEQLQIEAALRESEEQYERAVQASKVWVWDWSIQMDYLHTSPALKAALGYQEYEIGNSSTEWIACLHPDDRATATAAISASLNGTTPSYDLELRALHKNGTIFWFIVRGVVIYDDQGAPLHASGTSIDITTIKQVQHALRDNLRFVETLLNTIPSPVFYKDRAGCYLGCNRLFVEQIVGLPREQIIGRSLRDLADVISPEVVDLHEKHTMRLLREPGLHIYEAPVWCTDGHWRDFLFHKTTFPDDTGAVAGIVGVMLDITEHNRISEELHYRLALTHLITTISTRFITLSTDAIDNEIKQAVQHIVKLAEAEAVYISLLSDDVTTIETTYGWHSDGGEPAGLEDATNLSLTSFAWSMMQLHQYQVLNVPRVADLPPEAAWERDYMQSVGVQSYIMLPMLCSGSLVGVLTLITSRFEKHWSDNIIEILTMVGEIFANAIVRKRMDEKLHRINDELEQRVMQRTLELARSNEALQAEICERKRFAEELHQREVLMRLITDAVPALISYVDTKGCYRFNNKLYEEWFGYAHHELSGKHVETVIGSRLYEQALEKHAMALSGTSTNGEYPIQMPNGDVRYIHVDYIPNTSEHGQVQGFVVLGHDITATIRDRQELEQKVAERTMEIERRRQAAEALYETLQMLNTNRDIETILNAILQQACDLLGAAASAIYCPRSEQRSYIRATSGLPAEIADVGDLPIIYNDDWDRFFNRIPLVIEDLHAYWASVLPKSDDDWVAFAHKHGSDMAVSVKRCMAITGRFHACITVPLFIKDTLYGGMELYYAAPHEFSDEEVALVSAFGQQVALAIENARLRDQVKQLAVIEERQRMARNLHDSVTQLLYSLSLFAEAGKQLVHTGPPERLEAYLNEVIHTAQRANIETRLLIYQLRPIMLEHHGLVKAVRQRLERVEQRIGLQTRLLLDDDGDSALPASVEEELYSIVMEALNNVLRHAEASMVTVSLHIEREQATRPAEQPAEQSATRVSLTIADNGRGFEINGIQHNGGIGLESMRERAQRLGGSLTIQSRCGEGTTIDVRIAC